MSRTVLYEAHGPFEIKPSGKPVWVCMCGLSKNKPLCDGSHARAKDEEEGKLYVYGKERILEKYARLDAHTSALAQNGARP